MREIIRSLSDRQYSTVPRKYSELTLTYIVLKAQNVFLEGSAFLIVAIPMLATCRTVHTTTYSQSTEIARQSTCPYTIFGNLEFRTQSHLSCTAAQSNCCELPELKSTTARMFGSFLQEKLVGSA